MIQVKNFTFNAFQENTYVLYDETLEAVVVDPGCYDKEEQQELTDFVESKGLKVVLLINTHCHVDHVLGNSFVKSHFGVKLSIHPKEESTLKSVETYGPAYGFHNYQPAQADQYFEEGDTIKFGNSKLEILFVPGHSVGHVAFYNKEDNFCIGGDVLFYRSIGRYDLPGGDYQILMNSIKNKMFALPETMVIHPGHGPATTVGDEKKHNPFFQ
jgi:hydroxyacylglutathione hydrolase